MYLRHPLFLKFINALKEGCSEKSSEFRNFAFSNSSGEKVSSRIVVLRDFIEKNNTILFFSDLRSPKIKAILKKKATTCLFYSKKVELQMRVTTSSQLITEKDLVDKYWETVPIISRKAYLTIKPPSSNSEVRTDGLPDEFLANASSHSNAKKARENFAVVENIIKEVDVLSLSSNSYSRAKFVFQKDKIDMTWLVP